MPGPTDIFKTKSLRLRWRMTVKPRDVTEAEYLRAREKLLFGSLGAASPVKRIDPRTGEVVEIISKRE
jgi:branched-subunit amino acid aminotransferase/4-amino-4-deoxychorismate lyase